jgi:hypothetical protein
LRDNRDNVFRRKQGTFNNDFQPDRCLVQLFEYGFQLVNEVRPAFGAARRAIVGGRSCSGSQDLAANMAALSGPG